MNSQFSIFFLFIKFKLDDLFDFQKFIFFILLAIYLFFGTFIRTLKIFTLLLGLLFFANLINLLFVLVIFLNISANFLK